MRRRIGQRGNVAHVLSLGIIAAIAMFFSSLFVSSRKAVNRASQAEVASEKGGQRLRELLELPWEDPAWTEGEHQDGAESPFRWVVETVSPRLRRIALFTSLEEKGGGRKLAQAPELVAYRYHDH